MMTILLPSLRVSVEGRGGSGCLTIKIFVVRVADDHLAHVDDVRVTKREQDVDFA